MTKLDHVKDLLRPTYLKVRQAASWAQFHLGIRETEDKIERDAQRFWNRPSGHLQQLAHWRGAGVFQDDALWLAWGRGHLDLYLEFCAMLGRPGNADRILEWGSGGGAIAFHFAPLCREYFGVEVSQANLDECTRMLGEAGITNFRPVLIRTDAPEQALSAGRGTFDVVLCLGVFQALPTPEYGYRVLEIIHDCLSPDGIAVVQIKYVKKSWATKPKRFGYRRNYPLLTAYEMDEFWIEAQRRGFTPECIKLIPRHPVNGDGDYAYFLLRKARD